MTCADVRGRLDRYRDRLTPDSDASLIEAHLGSCGECKAVLANRVALLDRLKNAVRNAEVPPDLGHRVQFAIAKAGTPKRVLTGGFGRSLLAIAAALIVTAGAYFFWPGDDARQPKETQEQFIARLTSEVSPIMRVGLQQHVHCGVLREYPAVAPALADLARDKTVSPALIDAVETHAPQGLHVVMAHRCDYRGREYIHVVARGEGHLMSLLITKRAAGETFAGDLKASAHSGQDAYSIDAFETPDYLVYLISDSAPGENLRTLKAMEPQVQAALL
jgi:hypothetical protein